MRFTNGVTRLVCSRLRIRTSGLRLLFDLRVIDVGVIITRADHLQEIFDTLGRGPSYGSSTTHLSKLLPKLDGGSGGGCPVLVFGITRNLYVED